MTNQSISYQIVHTEGNLDVTIQHEDPTGFSKHIQPIQSQYFNNSIPVKVLLVISMRGEELVREIIKYWEQVKNIKIFQIQLLESDIKAEEPWFDFLFSVLGNLIE